MDAEHISLHRYLRNAPSDTEVLAEHHLRADRSAWPLEKHIWKHEKLGRMKELGGGGGTVGLDPPSVVGGNEAGV